MELTNAKLAPSRERAAATRTEVSKITRMETIGYRENVMFLMGKSSMERVGTRHMGESDDVSGEARGSSALVCMLRLHPQVDSQSEDYRQE